MSHGADRDARAALHLPQPRLQPRGARPMGARRLLRGDAPTHGLQTRAYTGPLTEIYMYNIYMHSITVIHEALTLT